MFYWAALAEFFATCHAEALQPSRSAVPLECWSAALHLSSYAALP